MSHLPGPSGRKGEPPEPHGTGWVYRLAWGFYLILAVAGAIWIGWREGRIAPTLFADPDSWWLDALLGAAAGAGLLALWALGRSRLAAARRLEEQVAELLGPLDYLEVAALALLSGFAEEVFFRGAVQGTWGWITATILFALLHTGPGAAFRAWTAFAFAAGLSFAWLTIWRGNLLAPIVAHVLVNAVNLARICLGERQRGERP